MDKVGKLVFYKRHTGDLLTDYIGIIVRELDDFYIVKWLNTIDKGTGPYLKSQLQFVERRK
ncbi:MAG: hypothetical protein Q8P81_03290 [Nanoarchaeota archaeon]|nr:hypothetical protein [Nanoarchaeota archaeon]